MLELNHVSKSYGKKTALDDVSFRLGLGEIVGLFGENGAGKTTLMKTVLGYLKHEGTVTLDGQPITKSNIAQLSFATCEHSFFPNLNALEHAEFYRKQFPGFRERRFRALMDFFELPDKKTIRQLSAGQQDQFEVILALSQGARYILMDEPFSGNDLFKREDFYRVLLGVLEPEETVLLSTHLIEEVSNFVGRALLLHRGKLLEDVDLSDLEDRGENLVDHVKKMYDYRSDRVSRALEQFAGE